VTESARPSHERGGAGPPKALRDLAYDEIKARIISCALKPGEYINEAAVCAMIGFGRTPVHQAIDRLCVEGLVDVIPRKGAIVKPMSFDEIMQIVEARSANEALGVRLAAQRIQPDEIEQLRAVLKDAEKALEDGATESLMRLDRDFHGVIARASRNVVLADILSKLHDRSLRVWFVSLNSPGRNRLVHDEHVAICEAIARHDPDAAEAAMRTHVESFRNHLRQNA
jgi:GntR family transcriptional regulator, rspAB operon transcriptional repressor